MINLSSLDLNNKNLVIRVDMNVPIRDGDVLDSTRIKACLPTIEYALENNAKVLLISHLGRPVKGNFEEEFSLKPVANELSKIINMDVELIDTLESNKIFKSSSNIQVLENIRFFEGEKENSQELGNKIGSLGDIYVFDAFGTAHREQASTHAAILLIEVSFISSPSTVLDVNTLLGSMILPLSKMLFAISSIDCSVSEFPTLRPEDFIKVFAIPPPTIIWSATSLICFISSSFVETFAPPIIAT